MRFPLAAVALLAVSCSQTPVPDDRVAETGAGEAPPAQQAAPAERVDLATAQALVDARIMGDTPSMNREARHPVRELTTDDVWESLAIQLFQVTDGPRSYRTYVVRGGTVTPIGENYGGYGVVSTCASDVNGDGALDLAYSFSWGSGMHRSHVAYADLTEEPFTEHVALETCFLMEDMMVRGAADGGVEVTLRGELIGRLEPIEGGVRLALADGVDASLLSR